jgi:hypothetical protein
MTDTHPGLRDSRRSRHVAGIFFIISAARKLDAPDAIFVILVPLSTRMNLATRWIPE